VRDVQNVSKMNEKNFKKQQEYLTTLNHQYTLVSEKLGIPTNFTFSKVDDLNEFLANKSKDETTIQIQSNNEVKNVSGMYLNNGLNIVRGMRLIS